MQHIRCITSYPHLCTRHCAHRCRIGTSTATEEAKKECHDCCCARVMFFLEIKMKEFMNLLCIIIIVVVGVVEE